MTINPDVEVISVSFRPDGITEITYSEKRDKGPQAEEYRTLMFDNHVAPRHVDELVEAVQDLIDVAKQFARVDSIPDEK